MTELAVLSLAVTAGVDSRMIVAMGLAILFPVWALGAVAIHTMRSRPAPSLRSAMFCQAVARDLSAGSSLRWALTTAATDGHIDGLARTIGSGASWEDVGSLLRREFADIGQELAMVVQSVAASGSNSEGLFAELGDLALAQIEMAEEIRVATAPARASAMVLIGMPVFYLAYQFRSGRFGELLALESSRGLAGAGLVLFVLGVGTSVMLVRRSR